MFAFGFDLLIGGTVMTHVLPSMELASWHLAEVFAYAVAYGLYPTLSAISLVAADIKTDWRYCASGVHFQNGAVIAAGNTSLLSCSLIHLLSSFTPTLVVTLLILSTPHFVHPMSMLLCSIGWILCLSL